MPEETAPHSKNRHGCLLVWLIFMIIINSLTALIYLFGQFLFKQGAVQIPTWAYYAFALFCLLNVFFAVLLLRWKKIAFWGFSLSTVLAFIANLMIGINIFQALLGLLGVPILFAVLQIGKENKGWSQLE